jgi:hypothetical protein
MKPRSLAFLVLLLIAAVVTWKLSRPSTEPATAAHADPAATRTGSAGNDRGKASSRDLPDAPPVTLNEAFDKKLYKAVAYETRPSGDDGSRAYVRVPSTNSRLRLAPNQLGEFPVQPAGLQETVAVRVDLPDANPGDPVAVTILDGGTFPSETETQASRLIKVEKWGGVSFQFTTSPNDGHHRLRVQPSGGRLKIVDFYATKNSSSENL